ncbi:hypothetical protein ACWC10_31180 [Streptomyces sp. NPDC001595]|uniref:hypothetical protein n=1 Tax=Streptomyces sp. NPDC001532 TaxID=3154520 RepID=UPI00332DC8C6
MIGTFLTPVGSGVIGDLARSEAADRLRAEAQAYLVAQVQRLLVGVGRGLAETTVKLTEIAEGRSPGFARLALDTGRKLAQGKGPARAVLELAAARLVPGRGGPAARPLVVVEQIDVGVPADLAYDVWSRHPYADAGPDERIVWTARGLRGVVSFHRLADDLTRVLLVAEHRPETRAERVGALWQAPRRRARRDLSEFARHVTLSGVLEGDRPRSAPEDNRSSTRRSRR